MHNMYVIHYRMYESMHDIYDLLHIYIYIYMQLHIMQCTHILTAMHSYIITAAFELNHFEFVNTDRIIK